MSKTSLCSQLYQAADNGDECAVRALLEQGADPNHESARGGYIGSFPLHVAATARSLECVNLLLKGGANPMNVTSSEGWTALHNATWRKDYAIVHRLLQAAPALCFVKGKKKSMRPIDIAREKKYLDIVELLEDTEREYLKTNRVPPGDITMSAHTTKTRRRKKKKRFSFLRKAKDRAKTLFSTNRDTSSSSAGGGAGAGAREDKDGGCETILPDRWTVRLRGGNQYPHLPQALRDAGKVLKSLLEEKGSCSEESRPFKTLKRLFASPCAVVSADPMTDSHLESDDQVFKDLAREAIVLNGSLFEAHIALKSEAALGQLRNALRTAFTEAGWEESATSDAIAFVLQACTRTTHGGVSHDVVNAIFNSDLLATDAIDSAIDPTLNALDSALASGDITKEEYAAIRSKTVSGVGMFVSPAKEESSSNAAVSMIPITPSHCADEALTQVVVRPSSVLVLASSAFDVGVPSKIVVQTTMETAFAPAAVATETATKANETTTHRILRLDLWQNGRDVAKALSKRGGVDSKSFGALMHSSLTTASAGSDLELARRRENSLSVTPLLDAARHLDEQVHRRTENASKDLDKYKHVPPPIAEKLRADATGADAPTVKLLLTALAEADCRNRQLLEELSHVVKERDAALGLLLQAGQNQAELMQHQKKRRREADLKHAAQIRALKASIQDKEFGIESLRQQVERLRMGNVTGGSP